MSAPATNTARSTCIACSFAARRLPCLSLTFRSPPSPSSRDWSLEVRAVFNEHDEI